MTSQTLMSNAPAVATSSRPQSVGAIASSRPAVVRPNPPSVDRLPYSKSQQVELLHLQAEVEALLQHVQVLKQRKQFHTEPVSQIESGMTE